MGYKLVFSDIDGTLLTSNHEISIGTYQSIQELKKKGVPFILVSARMPEGILPLQKELVIDDPIVCFSGALVLGAAQVDGSREVIYNMTMNTEDVENIYSAITNRYPSISFSAYNKEFWYVPTIDNEWIIQEREIAKTPAKVFHFDEEIYPPVNKVLCMGPPEDIAAFEKELKNLIPTITVYKSKPTYLEIMAENVKKSFAIHMLAKKYQVSRKEIMAIGDNFNDMDMLQFAGLGVAMGNSPNEVKATADVTTLSNDHDGLKEALLQYCLKFHDSKNR
ncbi:Cof-type HAD-IIB family hydrolase [Bacillus sp. 03113]|uniref:Cof-type HAD-IIB family hydrolase n=1 Tax=Bacillus sp. 03113 TaxID=2578211 RepID=UPI0011439D70|nr:Cof-type HAD-IIB family hydrolase [Bacillus sp. 03113]